MMDMLVVHPKQLHVVFIRRINLKLMSIIVKADVVIEVIEFANIIVNTNSQYSVR